MKNFVFVLMIIFSLVFVGCEKSKEEILQTTNTVYLDIKTVVTDPSVRPMFSEEELTELRQLERTYLTAVDVYDKSEDQDSLKVISDCASEILVLLTKNVVDDRYKAEITAVRLSIKILRNHINISDTEGD